MGRKGLGRANFVTRSVWATRKRAPSAKAGSQAAIRRTTTSVSFVSPWWTRVGRPEAGEEY
jgi:hypothetical protein